MPLQPRRGGPSKGGGGSNTRFTGKRGGSSRGRGRGGGGVAYGIDRPAPQREDDGTAAAEKFEEVRVWDEIDTKLGFERFESNRASGEEKVGWLVNMHQVSPFACPAETSQCGKLRINMGTRC
jgi:DNA polymerase epsilon subunit 1